MTTSHPFRRSRDSQCSEPAWCCAAGSPGEDRRWSVSLAGEFGIKNWTGMLLLEHRITPGLIFHTVGKCANNTPLSLWDQWGINLIFPMGSIGLGPREKEYLICHQKEYLACHPKQRRSILSATRKILQRPSGDCMDLQNGACNQYNSF